MKLKKIMLCAVLLVLIAAQAKASDDEVSAKIDDLQNQINALKEQSAAKAKFPVDIYGFAALQLFLGTARTQMYGGLNSVAVQSRVIDGSATGGGRHTWFGATPQNSRVGLNWKGSKVSEKLTIGGLFEVDFVNVINQTSYGTSPIPRIRHFYGELSSSDNWSLLFGQTWDLYSPLNSASLSLGGNLWFQGNLGFRRPQLRFTYNFILDDKSKIKLSASANLPSNTDDLMNSGISSGLPLGEMLVQYSRAMKYGDFIIAASGNLGANTVSAKYKKMTGIAGSLSIPLHKYFKLAGEVQYGQDQGIFLSYVNFTGNGYGGRDLAVWGQITSGWCDKFDTAAGYAIDDIKASKVVTGNVERNQVVFANFRYFPVKPFYVGLEYNYMRTNYKDHGSSPANIVFSNIVYTF